MNRNSGKINDICIVCEQQKTSGFYLYHSYICLDCEREIVQTNVEDPTYSYYIQQLRKVNKQPYKIAK